MQPQIDFPSFPYKNIFLCSISADIDYDFLVENLLALPCSERVFGFGRELWAVLSSGCVPPQLYSFNSSQSQLMIIGESSVVKPLGLIEGLEVIEVVPINENEMSGQLSSAAYVEDEFLGGHFLTFLKKSKNMSLEYSGVKLLSCSNRGSFYDFIFTEDMSLIDEAAFVGQDFIKAGGYFYLPSREKISELPEMLNDREKIHLDEKIRGIHC